MLRQVPALAIALGIVGQANAQAPGNGVRAMPAVVNVGVAAPAEATVVVAGGVGYGYLDAGEGQPAAGRAAGGLALAFSPLPELTFGADVTGRRDGYYDGVNWYGEPRLSARFATALSATQFLGATLDARFIGAEAPSIEWTATSPSLRGLYAARLRRQTWLGVEIGFELDRSVEALPHLARMSVTDKRTLAASSWNSIPVGLGVAHDLGAAWQLLGELSGKWLVGAANPTVLQSPWRGSAGVRHRLSPSWSAQLGVEVALSQRPTLPAAQTLPQEPRVSGFLGLVWTLPREVAIAKAPPKLKPPPKPVFVAPVQVEAPKPPLSAPVVGTLVDEGGRPLADAKVVLLREGVEVGHVRTTGDGQFAFDQVTLGPVVLRVNESGYEPIEVSVGAAETRSAELVLRPAVPAGQVRGKVLDLQGNPITAQVTVKPGELSSTTALDGSFELDLAPGRYTVRFEHPSFAPQRRTIVVKDRGVVILNISLVR
jgi:Carboxypeptidase regulatory-like domain